MRISARADYALRSLVALARDRDRPLTSDFVAQEHGIPARYLKSLFVDLRRAGLVRSQRGCEGGYWIGRDPAAISLADVLLAADGDVATRHGEPVGGAGPDSGGYWAPVVNVLQLALSGLTVADVVAGVVPAPLSTAISALEPAGIG